jgi:hypothetical protein
MSAPSWLYDICFNCNTENDGLLRIDFMSSGMECYYKQISTKEFESGKYSDKFKKNPSSLKDDGMETILNFADLEYEVDLNGKTIIKMDSLNGKENLIKSNKKNWNEFLNIENDDYLMIWGHGGICGFTVKFANIKKFDAKKLNLNINSFNTGKEVKEYFMGDIQYDGNDPTDLDTTFEPKHGYWGPIFVNLKV